MEPSTEHLITRGREAFERRDYAAALKDFRVVLAEHPNFADVRHLAGLCLSFLGHAEAALTEFDEAIAINERYVEAHVNRAITLNELGRLEEARDAFEQARAHELDPARGPFTRAVAARLANAHAAVGDLYVAAGAAERAVAEYRKALELRPEFPDIRNQLALALLETGELDGAEAELRQALEANPSFLTARINLGLVLFRRGDLAAAGAVWTECAAAAPTNAQVRAYRAMLRASGAPGAQQVDATDA